MPAEVDWGELARLVLRFARQRGDSIADAEDVAQDALLALWTQADGVRDPARWLFVVARRLAHKRRMLKRSLQVDSDLDVLNRHVHHDRPTVEAALQFLQTHPRLSPRDRAVLRLWAQGHTHREIARRIGCARSDVGQYLSRALTRLEETPTTGKLQRIPRRR